MQGGHEIILFHPISHGTILASYVKLLKSIANGLGWNGIRLLPLCFAIIMFILHVYIPISSCLPYHRKIKVYEKVKISHQS